MTFPFSYDGKIQIPEFQYANPSENTIAQAIKETLIAENIGNIEQDGTQLVFRQSMFKFTEKGNPLRSVYYVSMNVTRTVEGMILTYHISFKKNWQYSIVGLVVVMAFFYSLTGISLLLKIVLPMALVYGGLCLSIPFSIFEFRRLLKDAINYSKFLPENV